MQENSADNQPENFSDDSLKSATNIERKDLEETTYTDSEVKEKNYDEPSDIEEKSAQERMSDYMNFHNYGLGDKGTYMSDVEWISINRDLKAELWIPQTPQEQMMDYMGSHNYGIWDRDTYMKDPKWQALNA